MPSRDLSQPEIARHQKREMLQKIGIDPYPSQAFKTTSTAQEVLAEYSKNKPTDWEVVLAGRIMARRIMGKTCFMSLQDHTGKIQLYIQRDKFSPSNEQATYNEFVKKLLDIGDIIGIKGRVFTTQTGETSIEVHHLTLLTKSLKPLPDVKEVSDGNETKRFNDFTKAENRYRQRYVDLILHPHVRDTFTKRAQIIQTLRRYFDKKDYLEVETPILQPIHGGASAKPFKTHHNSLNIPLYLRIANELYLKRLIVGGYQGVYEFAKDFRNEGMSRFHNPEFTLLEVYVAYQDYLWMMEQTETMLSEVAQVVHGTAKVKVGNHIIDFTPPWKRFTLYEAIEQFTGINVENMDEEALQKVILDRGISLDKRAGRGKLLDEIFGEACEPHMIQPTFITDYPVETSPLAKRHRDNPKLVERFEVICNGKEICNAFSELNDPIDQRKRFEEQLSLAKKGDEEAMVLDEDYLRALSYGMPPTVGLGIGIDRLTMIMTNQPSIQDVLFFPQMRPEKK